MLPGIKTRDLDVRNDDRGFFAEVMRGDWKDLLDGDQIAQINLSVSYPGMIRAWHRHSRGQVDYFIVLRGAMKVCAYDDNPGSATRGQLDEYVLGASRLQALRIPGLYWHGTKAVGDTPSLTVYLSSRLYDYGSPDEGRRPWNDSSIMDPRTRQPFDWNKPPHK